MSCNILWSIWKARNRWIFDKVDLNIQNIIQQALFSYNRYNSPFDPGASLSVVSDSLPTVSMKPTIWIPPYCNSVKINVDGALKGSELATGVVIRDSSGNVKACQIIYDGNWKGFDGAIEAEARAFLKGIELARDLHFQSIIVEGDSQLMVKYLTETITSYPWRLRSLIVDCKSLLKTFLNFSVCFIPRSVNTVAHLLAKEALNKHYCHLWVDSYPDCISNSIISDRVSAI
ncbi:Ribonuclease H domain [Macleaya cordata]|uniref:Ribonuclease H domain n=1 Tax=Macleaya cordata TaxID=56857 RepID=A0A200R0X1_MACCD|nr:Ribonuclease H domain [Macleaya cordata]